MGRPKKARLPHTRRRQLGSERRRDPLPTVHDRPSAAKLVWARIAIIVTVAAWLVYIVSTVVRQILLYGTESLQLTLEAVLYAVVVTFLTFSALMYLVAREGALRRFREHVRVPRAELDRHFAGERREGMTVLIPSYAEEPAVIRKTMWSAALQEYPDLRVVLLLDDPPHPTDSPTITRLEETRGLAHEIAAALEQPASRAKDALLAAEHEVLVTGDIGEAAAARLVEEYEAATLWLRYRAEQEPHEDHVDTFFIDQVLLGLADDLELTARAVAAALAGGSMPSAQRVLELHRRLVRLFSVETDTFERKAYNSLSHEPNKAMNLNAYIGLMGGRYREVRVPGGGVGLRLVAGGQPADRTIPDAEYLLTLDADSLLLRDYCLRLVYFLEQPGNARVAVTQTPYSSFRGAPTRIERLAGATTDIQHILHQGFSAYDATFWVGANAVIRMEALDDILELDTVDGLEVRRYVQDRTVIEDTESSIDLGREGWTLVNYPERLSYSATPPDFGSLVVQRRRWANGGLLILSKFLTQVRSRKRAGRPLGLTEIMLRTNYMASLSWASFGLLFLLVYPFDSRMLSPLVLLAALPYFLAQASDLRYSGYRRSDIFRIYGFNLILLPVNLAGVLKSIEQALTGRKIPFARTPKVRDRTATPLLYVVAPYAIVFLSVFAVWRGVVDQNWGTAAFAAFNALCAGWAVLENIGLVNSAADTWLGLTDWMWVDIEKTAKAPVETATDLDWEAALYLGHPAAGDRSTRQLRLTIPPADEPTTETIVDAEETKTAA